LLHVAGLFFDTINEMDRIIREAGVGGRGVRKVLFAKYPGRDELPRVPRTCIDRIRNVWDPRSSPLQNATLIGPGRFKPTGCSVRYRKPYRPKH
jgi:hypothetical protein